MTITEIIVTILLGTTAGFINTFAGGGSMLVVPFLIFIGLPANVANATNRIAILLQNVVSVGSFKQKKILDFKTDSKLLLPVALGSIAGAFIAVDINEEIFKKVIAGLLIIMFFMLLLNPDAWVKANADKAKMKSPWLRNVIFFSPGNLRRIHPDRYWIFPIGRVGTWMWLRSVKSQCHKTIYRTILHDYRPGNLYLE